MVKLRVCSAFIFLFPLLYLFPTRVLRQFCEGSMIWNKNYDLRICVSSFFFFGGDA